jgi:Ser/Thr protein kinase RdoA (MazF antagonist)
VIRRPEATLMEAAWVRAIAADTDLRVPNVIAPTGAEPLVVIDGDGRRRGALILAWIDGRKMRWRFAAHHAYALGAAAAQLHGHAHDFVPPAGAWAKTWSPAAHVGTQDRDVIEGVAGPQAMATIDRALEQLAGAFDDLGSTDWMLVNGDLGPHNVVWEGHAPGLFDFNDLGWGYTAFDLGRYLHGLRWRPRGEQLVEAALAGYQSVAPLPDSFIRYGRLFEAAAGLFLAHYLAGRLSTRGEDAARTIRDVVARAEAVVG